MEPVCICMCRNFAESRPEAFWFFDASIPMTGGRSRSVATYLQNFDELIFRMFRISDHQYIWWIFVHGTLLRIDHRERFSQRSNWQCRSLLSTHTLIPPLCYAQANIKKEKLVSLVVLALPFLHGYKYARMCSSGRLKSRGFKRTYIYFFVFSSPSLFLSHLNLFNLTFFVESVWYRQTNHE